MKRLEVAPRSPDWHAIRSESWTASTAAVLVVTENAKLLKSYAATKGVELDIEPILAVGIDTYFDNTPWRAWADKTGRIPRFAGNAHTARGQENEGRVVQKFEEDQLMMVERDVTALSSVEPWLLASFDAVAPASSDPAVAAPYGFPVEAKCPAFQSRKKLWDAKKAELPELAKRKAAWEARGGVWGSIMGLPYYWCQVQHQIMVAEAPYGWFVAAGVEADADGVEKVVFPIVEKVPRDEAFLTAYLALARFYHSEFIDSCIEPPKLPIDEAFLKGLTEKATFDKAIVENNHDVAIDLYLNALREEEASVERRKELEAKVLATASAMRAVGSDVVLLADRLQVTYSSSKSVSWQKVSKEMAKRAGLAEVPPDVLTACESKVKESVKLKEVS